MLIARIEGATRVCGKSQGYLGLPVRDEIITTKEGINFNIMHSAWEATPKEIENISEKFIYVSILGFDPLPMTIMNCKRVIFDNGSDIIHNQIIDGDKKIPRLIIAFKPDNKFIDNIKKNKNLICSVIGISPQPMRMDII